MKIKILFVSLCLFFSIQNVMAEVTYEHIEYLKKQADIGDTQAKKQLELYTDSIEQAQKGNPLAQFRLGQFYLMDENYRTAKEWLLKSANQDFQPAEELLIKLYSNIGVWDDIPEQKVFLQKMVDRGNASAQLELGKLYFFGSNKVNKNYYKAAELFKKASDQNDLSASIYLALCYLEGWGVSKDIDKVSAILEKASEDEDDFDTAMKRVMTFLMIKDTGMMMKIMFDIEKLKSEL